MMLRVEEFMTSEVAALGPEDTVARADEEQTRVGVRHLPVIDGARKVVGMVSGRDLRRALSQPKGAALRLAEVMTHPVETIEPEAPAAQAVELMLERHIGALPVVDEHGALIGIVTDTDFLQVARRALSGKTGYELASL
jgi:CBS domain-containing protein